MSVYFHLAFLSSKYFFAIINIKHIARTHKIKNVCVRARHKVNYLHGKKMLKTKRPLKVVQFWRAENCFGFSLTSHRAKIALQVVDLRQFNSAAWNLNP
jgi:hypothetical protein